MLNHIAVVLRGHMRTWYYLAPAVFDFYNSIAKNVDYYVSTWQMSGVRIADIEKSFVGQNLIKAVLVPVDERYYTSWKGSGWLNFNLLPHKKFRETQVRYDAVFDSRPDIINRIRLHNRCVIQTPEENTLYVGGLTIQKSYFDDKNHIAIRDHFLMSSSNVFDLMAYRYIEDDIHGSQIQYTKYIDKWNVKLSNIYWVESVITRPNQISIVPDSKKYFDISDNGNLRESWMDLPKDKKIQILTENDIQLADYITDSIVAKI
jgi:hypothetical protein